MQLALVELQLDPFAVLVQQRDDVSRLVCVCRVEEDPNREAEVFFCFDLEGCLHDGEPELRGFLGEGVVHVGPHEFVLYVVVEDLEYPQTMLHNP